MSEADVFYQKVALALSGCQLVEQELKLYITQALDLARKCIDGRLPFRLEGSDYENSPLAGLIKIFRKLNDNETLIRDLDRFRAERNFLSHNAIARCLDYEGELSLSMVAEFDERLDAIREKSNRLREELHREANRFRGHLWFEDLSKGG